MKGARGIALALLALALLWFLVTVFGSGEQEVAPARTFTSSEQCRECHPTEFAEWEESSHSVSWTNPRVRLLSNDFTNQDCIDCHAPRPVFETGIGQRVLMRMERRPEGVDCITCHQLPAKPDGTDGGMAGTTTSTTAACRPVARLELSRPDFCAGCHNQHKTVDQWRESEWAHEGADCLTCHMPVREGDTTRARSHRFPGGDDLAMLQSAVELRGARSGDGWTIEIENVGAGHAFPTDERSRTSDVFWRPLPAEGGEAGRWRHLHRIRDPYRDEVDIVSTLLHAGETRTLTLDASVAPEATGAVEVVLFYMRSPYFSDIDSADPLLPDPEEEATEVHRIELVP
jgi:hypothetical protein